jgi:hypothetical protein
MDEQIAALKEELLDTREDRDRTEKQVLDMLEALQDWTRRAILEVEQGGQPGYLHLHTIAREFEDPVRELRQLREKERGLRLRIADVVLGEGD